MTRQALKHPRMSAFVVLFGTGVDQSLITVFECGYRAFRAFIRDFEPIYNHFTPCSENGRIRQLSIPHFGRPSSMLL